MNTINIAKLETLTQKRKKPDLEALIDATKTKLDHVQFIDTFHALETFLRLVFLFTLYFNISYVKLICTTRTIEINLRVSVCCFFL